MFDMNSMMGKMKEAQENLKKTQDNLKNVTLSTESGAGMVKTTINGNREIIDLQIDESLFTKDDKEMVQDLVVAAVNKALQEIDLRIKEEMQANTAGMLPNIPGLDLSKLF